MARAIADRPAQPMEYRILLTATMCLLAVGAVMVYSASSARDLLSHGGGSGSGYLERYVIYGALGLLAMRVLSRHGLEAVRRATPLLLGIALVMVVAVMIPGVGVEVNGARRWLGAGPVQFQPAEMLKLALVLYAVGVLASRPRCVETLRDLANPLLVVGGLACLLVALQPDLGTALVIALTMACLLIAAGVRLGNLLVLGSAGATLVMLYALMEPYRRARLTAFLNPWADAAGTGFQSVQGQIALGSGGLLGVGLGQSVQKVFYLPEAHTDFILAVIGEEIGVMGVCGVLFLYGMIAYAGLRVARTAEGRYAQLLAAGLTALILCQVTINVFAVLGLAPLTGVPLPFISYGSSNLTVLLATMGLLLNIAAGGNVRLRDAPATPRPRPVSAVRDLPPPSTSFDAQEDRDRRRRDRGARRARAGGGRRAAG